MRDSSDSSADGTADYSEAVELETGEHGNGAITIVYGEYNTSAVEKVSDYSGRRWNELPQGPRVTMRAQSPDVLCPVAQLRGASWRARDTHTTKSHIQDTPIVERSIDVKKHDLRENIHWLCQRGHPPCETRGSIRESISSDPVEASAELPLAADMLNNCFAHEQVRWSVDKRAKVPTSFAVTLLTMPTTSTSELTYDRSRLPPPFSSSLEPFQLIAQGAESLLYRTTFLTAADPSSGEPVLNAALKVRPKKTWRHPSLDKKLTRARVLAEARVLAKCRRDGVPVPAVLGLDWEAGWCAMEWIEGGSIKAVVRAWDESVKKGEDASESDLKTLLAKIGQVVGQLHRAGVVHGDLTTSNMMLRPTTTSHQTPADGMDGLADSSFDGQVVLIDFGLATQGVHDEDRAVDLYVLERAFGSTHPRQEHFFEEVLAAYGKEMGKSGRLVLRKLEDVRMRGRKKTSAVKTTSPETLTTTTMHDMPPSGISKANLSGEDQDSSLPALTSICSGCYQNSMYLAGFWHTNVVELPYVVAGDDVENAEVSTPPKRNT
nr:ekc/keops complex subunit bud32 [Quercus suber]